MESKVLEHLLVESRDTKKIIGIRKSNDILYVGYIVDFNDLLVEMQQVTKYGREDGLIIIKIANVETFETDDEYLKSYQFLFQNYTKIKKQTVMAVPITESENWQYETLLNLMHEQKLVTIEVNNDGLFFHGYISDLDDTHLSFNAVSHIGRDEGFVVYKLEDISSLSVDELESRKRQAFYDWRKEEN